MKTLFLAGRIVSLKNAAIERTTCELHLWNIVGRFFGRVKPTCTCSVKS